MDEQAFLEILSKRASDLHINPFLLLAGLESLYTFRDVPMNALNLEFLDSMVLTLFTLRIGDQFHALAEQQMQTGDLAGRLAAEREIEVVTEAELQSAQDPYLRSFAAVLQGSTPVRRYHLKALEAAALEIGSVQARYANNSIGTIIIGLCANELADVLPLGSLFNT